MDLLDDKMLFTATGLATALMIGYQTMEWPARMWWNIRYTFYFPGGNAHDNPEAAWRLI